MRSAMLHAKSRPFKARIRAFSTVVVAIACCSPLLGQSPEKRAALSHTDELTPVIHEMSMTLWEYTELAMLEYRSVEYLTRVLQREGF